MGLFQKLLCGEIKFEEIFHEKSPNKEVFDSTPSFFLIEFLWIQNGITALFKEIGLRFRKINPVKGPWLKFR